MNEVEEWLNEHGSIITTAPSPLKIGEVIHISEGVMGLAHTRSIGQPFVVVREATEKEYKSQVQEILRRAGSKRVYIKVKGIYYYEIRTD